MVKKDTKKSIIKPVSFTQNNETDVIILKYIESNNLAFSSYVKDLITTDMRKIKDKNEIAEAINNLTKAIYNSDFKIVQNDIGKEETKEDDNSVDEERKNIIGNLLNMSKSK